MKIGLITSMKSGLPQFVFRDIKALKDRGHDVRLYTLRNDEGLYNPLPEWEVIPVRWIKIIMTQIGLCIKKPRLFLRLLNDARKTSSLIDLIIATGFVNQMQDIDIIYAYFGDHKLFTGYYCKLISQIPLVVSIRAYELYKNPNPSVFIKALKYCDQVITISNFNKSILVDRYGVHPSQIEVVRQYIDLEKYKYEEKIKILIVAFFSEKKGHEVLFRALNRLNRDDIELWVVGDVAPDRRNVDCRSLVAELGIEAKVAFFGAQSGVALRALYRESDIFCLPSRTDLKGDREGFPNVIAEAMAFGKPVVTTRHAGIPEIVERVLVDENNIEQLADALNQVCDSAALRRQLGERNRVVVEQAFSSGNSDKVEQILLQYARK